MLINTDLEENDHIRGDVQKNTFLVVWVGGPFSAEIFCVEKKMELSFKFSFQKNNIFIVYVHKKKMFSYMSVKAWWGGGGLKALADMSAKNISFLTAPLSRDRPQSDRFWNLNNFSRGRGKHMIINTEWGAFGNNGELDFIFTR